MSVSTKFYWNTAAPSMIRPGCFSNPKHPWLWPPLSLLLLHWPPGGYPNTQATSQASPWPVHDGLLYPSDFLQGSAQATSNQRHLHHRSVSPA